MLLYALLSFFTLISANPLRRVDAPTVTISNGTVIGSVSGGIESFKGIPFAQSPTGPLRLRPPLPLAASFGTFAATGNPRACPQFFSQVDGSNLPTELLGLVTSSPLFHELTTTGEDCLNLNIQRPVGTTSSAKLPVVVWIFGGAFELGSTQMYDGTMMVQKSIKMGVPILFVAMNYRVGGFGFLAGKEVQADGSTNLGLRDQRLALQWVQDNIAAFGGDASQVTIWGESAGAISVFDHLTINSGDNSYHGKPLFRAAIMNSGSIVPTSPVDSLKPQAIFDTVVSRAGCSEVDDKLECLRSKSYKEFLHAANSVPSLFTYAGFDLSYLPRPDPSDGFFSESPETSLDNGAFTKVPLIIGDQNDEGTLFALVQSNITTTDELTDYLASFFPETSREIIAGLVATYPESPSAGSPFGTGVFNNIYPQFKRLAAILGDYTFTLARRIHLSVVSETVPSWSYLNTFLSGTPVLGTFHGSDLLEMFFGVPFVSPKESMQDYYVSFIASLDPNVHAPGLSNWPQYDNSHPKLLEFTAVGNGLINDSFRPQSFAYLKEHLSNFRV